MRTKMAVSFANILMAKIETTLIQQSETKPKEWRRYIDDIFSLWDSDKNDVDQFTEQANKVYLTNSRPKYQRTRLVPKIKNLTVRLSCEGTAKTTRGVRAGLSLTYSLKIRQYQKWRTATRETPGH